MKILKCVECGLYTLKETCAKCNGRTKHVEPARYSPQDPYGRYRRMMKEEMASG
ncbi:MAG: RNA-protein complex protein Nop10 [Candidatus Altiarchaeota archaeon]